MLISAVSDIHAPLYLQSFLTSLKSALPKTESDIFLLGGDICEVSQIEYYKTVCEALPKCPVFACFGNTESGNRESKQDYDNIKKMAPNIKFLQEETAEIILNGKKVCILGSKGVIDYPVKWQRNKIQDIMTIQEERIKKLAEAIKNINGDINILLTHHPPTFATMGNESPAIHGALGSKKMEKIIEKSKLDLIIHGHLHAGAGKGFIGNKPVFNIAFPVNRQIVEINTDSKKIIK